MGEKSVGEFVASVVERLNCDLALLGHAVTATGDNSKYPSVHVSIDGEPYGWEIDGDPATLGRAVVGCVTDAMSEHLHWGEPWPPCPARPTHPMLFESATDTWVCEADGVRIPLGELNT